MADKQIKDWITVNHKHVPIYEGETQDTAVNRAIADSNEEIKNRQMAQAKEQAEIASGKSVNTVNKAIEPLTLNDKDRDKKIDDLKKIMSEIKAENRSDAYQKLSERLGMGVGSHQVYVKSSNNLVWGDYIIDISFKKGRIANFFIQNPKDKKDIKMIIV